MREREDPVCVATKSVDESPLGNVTGDCGGRDEAKPLSSWICLIQRCLQSASRTAVFRFASKPRPACPIGGFIRLGGNRSPYLGWQSRVARKARSVSRMIATFWGRFANCEKDAEASFGGEKAAAS